MSEINLVFEEFNWISVIVRIKTSIDWNDLKITNTFDLNNDNVRVGNLNVISSNIS
jgi:hypothetical protein